MHRELQGKGGLNLMLFQIDIFLHIRSDYPRLLGQLVGHLSTVLGIGFQVTAFIL